ncbi:SipW-cognate class signal peptide [Lentibacillus halodurans]|uniref:SipW-cognate class signal peptide n=1 Tax=Lentibacillus halodurans TaxID=237679 RepID=A0A1I1AFD1_9BACI|nr:SipW-dependent-type signal peptide-containing protein [Lentibacillus halodurans]SFB36066.1 SipW-cognate class signal peptide [Lentibacillus halodurans]
MGNKDIQSLFKDQCCDINLDQETEGRVGDQFERPPQGKNKPRNVFILHFFKMVMFMYLLLFSAGYVTTNTAAYLTDHQESNGSVSIGKWEQEDIGVSLTGAEEDEQAAP